MDEMTKGGVMDRYDRERLVEVLVYHWQTRTSGCGCGGMTLGQSYPEHVANMYEQALGHEASPGAGRPTV